MSQSYYGAGDASSAGAVLAAAREQLNLSIAEVARHLKLSPAQVEALEAGAYERLPGRVFVRGFLRNYAKLLGLDPQPLLHRIEQEMPEPRVVEEPPHPPEEVMPTGERSRWPVYAGIAGVIIAALAAYEFGFNSPQTSEAEPEASAPPSVATAPEATSSNSASTSSETLALPRPGAAAASAPLTASEPSTTGAGEAAATSPAGQAPSQQNAPPGTRALHFRFDQESWVEVRDANDKVIFTKLNRAGSEERVAGTPPFKLVVGNARGVRLTYDDQPVDLAQHTGVSVARLTLQ